MTACLKLWTVVFSPTGHTMVRETVYCNLKHGWGRRRCYSNWQVTQWAVKQSAYVTTFRTFSQTDVIILRAKPEWGIFQQTSQSLEEESKMSAPAFLLPIVYA